MPDSTAITADPARHNTPGTIAWLIGLSLLATIFAKLPQLTSGLDPAVYYANNSDLLATLPLLAFLIILRRPPGAIAWISLAAAFGAVLLCNRSIPPWGSTDLEILARIHRPIALWALVALPFIGRAPRAAEVRVAFVAFSGEMVLLTASLISGGIVMSLLTYWIFKTVGIDIAEWYARNVVVWGLVTAPLVAALLAAGVRPVAIVGRVAVPFVPLLVLTLIAYLTALAAAGGAPLADRTFLSSLNMMMVATGFVSLAVICDRARHPEPHVDDYLNLLLVGLTLIITVVALGSIIVRIIVSGIDPVRAVVFGTDLSVLPLMLGVLWRYPRFIIGRAPLSDVTDWIARYLPILPAWALVVWLLPLFLG